MPLAKTASARALLALAVAALCLAGCGSGSDDSQSGSTSAQGSAAAGGESGGQQASSTSPSGAGASEQAANKQSGHPGQSATPDSSSSSSPSGHGSRLPQPKGAPEKAPTAEERAQATVADMSLQSPAIVAANGEPGRLAATYTCDGKDSWPALQWSGVPADTAELALYLMNIQPVEGKLFVDWAIAGLDPGLESIEAGKLPQGVITATNSFGKRGYSLCPQNGAETYMFILYALPERLAPPAGFDAREFRPQILDVSRNAGLLPAVYER